MTQARRGIGARVLLGVATVAAPVWAGPSAPPPSGALPDLPAAPPAPSGAAPAPGDSSAPGGSAPDQQKKQPPGPPPAPPPPPGYAPPPAYPAPYAYPPPYPYAGTYPPPYYAYPPPPAPPEPERTLPEHAAARGSPFLEGELAGLFFDKRLSSPFVPGVQAGVYALERIRIAARVLTFTSQASTSPGYQPSYTPLESDPTIAWGATVGYAMLSARTFVLSPGITFLGIDKSFGYYIGGSLPFDWVLSSGFRIGFELDVGTAFGGSYPAQCYAGPPTCAQGSTTEFERKSGQAYVLAFTIGVGLNHPAPE